MVHVLQPGEQHTFRLGFQDRPGRVSVTHDGREENLWLRDFKLGNVTVEQGDQPLAHWRHRRVDAGRHATLVIMNKGPEAMTVSVTVVPQ
jgi:hypothetical protein